MAQELVNEGEGASLGRGSKGASLVPGRRSEKAGGMSSEEGLSQPAKLTSTTSTFCGVYDVRLYVCTLLLCMFYRNIKIFYDVFEEKYLLF